MAQTVNDVATSLNANYKQTYADKIEMVIPEGVHFLKDIKFAEGEQAQGGTYNQPVCLALEQGMTYAAGDAVVNLNAPIAGKLENATVTGYQMIMRAQISYPVASRSSKGKNYFRSGAGVVLENMMLSFKKRAEASILYGQQGLTTVASVAGSVMTCTAAEWAEGLWIGMTNAKIDVYVGATAVLRQTCTITAIDPVAKTITVDTIGGIAAADTIYYYGAYGLEQMGIHKILTSSATTVFNVSQVTYPDLWVGTSYSAAGGQLTYAKIVKAAAKALPKGGEGRFKVYCHPESWQDVVNEPETARTSSDKFWTPAMVERGTDQIKFHCVAGTIELVASTYVKRGYAYGLLQDGSWKRIGSTDITPRIPGVQGEGDIFLHMPNTNGFELRAFSDAAVFCDKIGAQFVITSIVPST